MLHRLQRLGRLDGLAAGTPGQRNRMRRRNRREQGRFLFDETFAKLSVEVNQTSGSSGVA
jgi:hypothetical protein